MSRSTLILAFPCLLLAVTACRQRPSMTPQEPQPSVPVTQDDPIEGDPTAVEREEIGEDYVDSAQVVEPGPAEAEVQKRDSMQWPEQ